MRGCLIVADSGMPLEVTLKEFTLCDLFRNSERRTVQRESNMTNLTNRKVIPFKGALLQHLGCCQLCTYLADPRDHFCTAAWNCNVGLLPCVLLCILRN